MSWEVSDFVDAFIAEIGDDLSELVTPDRVMRWVNEGQSRLRFYRQQTASLSWLAGDVSIAAPTDFHHAEKFLPDTGSVGLPDHHAWGGALRFDSLGAAWGGSGTLYYWGKWPDITTSQPSLLPAIGDQACLSFALYRFFKRLASSRSDYRLYASLRQANGVTVQDLDAISERHLDDFNDARDDLGDEATLPEQFFGED